MRSTYKTVLVVLLVMNLLVNPALLAWGNPVPGRWEKAMQTLPGEKITVYTKDNAKRKYIYVSIEEDFLNCANEYEYENKIQIELTTINKIIVYKAGKYAKHGALWGAAGGAGVIGVLALNDGLNPTEQGYVAGVIFGAVLGAGLGYLAGAAAGSPGEIIFISKEAALAK